MPNVGYHGSRWEGKWARESYRALLPVIVRRRVPTPRAVSFAVFSYSGEASLPEQVRSIRSFLRHVGRPAQFTVVSDGSHLPASVRLLEEIDPVVTVRRASEWRPAALPVKFERYLASHPTGKQLGLIMSLPQDVPALYADSDVLFFPGGAALPALVAVAGAPAFYLPDCRACSADPRIFRAAAEEQDPVNTGLLVLFRPLDWSLGIERFLELEGDPQFFTNQTITHLTMHANGARPLDPRQCVLQLDDQFVYADRYAGPGIILRHYVQPVRHKFWATLLH